MIPAFVNPTAGNAPEVSAALRGAGCFRVVPVSADEVTEAVSAAVHDGVHRVAAVGGDGTISAAAAAIAGRNVDLVVVPAGKFNHFARDNGIPLGLNDACAIAASPRVRHVDVASVNGRLFLNTSSAGLYTNYLKVREQLESRIGYWPASAIAMARTFARVRPFSLRFESDILDRPYETPLAFIGVGERELKLPKLGGRIEGGRSGLHVLIVRGGTRARLLALALAAAARGTRAVSRTPHVDSFLVDRCTIEQRHASVSVDGEIVRIAPPLNYEILRGALRVVLPSNGRHLDGSP
ncbi:MAG TPA: diacylglycerol kinase family protein [Gemmatimonadaceae bacterium]|nr:diacylglycerol kinase family protein [Gemmatimonadaceae bacterium]